MGLKGREVVGWSPSGLAGQVLSSFRVPRPLPSPAHPAQTHVPQVEGDFQLTPEAVCKCRVQVQHLQQVCTLDLVQVTVGQGPHICTGLARPGVKANGLPKDVVLTCQPEGQGFLQGLAPRCPWKSLPEGPLITNPPPTSRPLRGGGGGSGGGENCQAGPCAQDQALGTGPDVLAGGGEGLDVRPAFSFVL